jgi:peptidyl-prolyl cis-trans isomerase SurA
MPLKDAPAAPATPPAKETEEEPGSVPPIDLPPLPPLDPKEALPAPPALVKPPTTDESLERTALTQPAPASKSAKAPARPEDDPGLPLPPLDPKQALPAVPALSAPPKASEPPEPRELPLPVMPLTTPVPTGTTSAAPTKEPAPAPDPAVQPASVSNSPSAAAEIRSTGRPVEFKEAGRAAAIVGDEVITMREMAHALNDRMRNVPQGQRFSPEEQQMIVMGVLDTLIERSVILQEAKRMVKDPKKLQMLNDMADKVFREEELPHMLHKTSSTNEFELKRKMAERGQSLDETREQFRRDFLAKGFLEQKLSHKMKVELPEMYDYYYAHQHDFDEPAQIAWREVVVEVGKYPSRVDARRKADAVLGRLRRGEDFAQVAKAESDGPNKSAGGLWQTSPGSYAVIQVNDALGRLPLNQVSPVIEAPSSYHIIRVEKLREAGPAPFPEVQDRVRRILHEEKVKRESAAFIKKLRDQTVVTTMFDRKDDEAIQAAAPASAATSAPTP